MNDNGKVQRLSDDELALLKFADDGNCHCFDVLAEQKKGEAAVVEQGNESARCEARNNDGALVAQTIDEHKQVKGGIAHVTEMVIRRTRGS